MSSTTEKEEAEKYAAFSGAPVIFEIQQGMVCKGADISWLSQFPAEKEVLTKPSFRTYLKLSATLLPSLRRR